MKKKRTFKNSSILALIITLLIFICIFSYIALFPKLDSLRKNNIAREEGAGLKNWQQYEEIVFPQVMPSISFDELSEEQQAQYHRNFLFKTQKCLLLNLNLRTETQYINSLLNGAKRDAILRGFLASIEVTELVKRKLTPFVSNEAVQFSRDFNENFLLRDDFELPPDISMYEVKLALVDEILNAADAHQVTDRRLFYLWAANILKKYQKNSAFTMNMTNGELLELAMKLPLDHLTSESALSVCAKFDELKVR